jgi:hypothetical protein
VTDNATRRPSSGATRSWSAFVGCQSQGVRDKRILQRCRRSLTPLSRTLRHWILRWQTCYGRSGGVSSCCMWVGPEESQSCRAVCSRFDSGACIRSRESDSSPEGAFALGSSRSDQYGVLGSAGFGRGDVGGACGPATTYDPTASPTTAVYTARAEALRACDTAHALRGRMPAFPAGVSCRKASTREVGASPG